MSVFIFCSRYTIQSLSCFLMAFVFGYGAIVTHFNCAVPTLMHFVWNSVHPLIMGDVYGYGTYLNDKEWNMIIWKGYNSSKVQCAEETFSTHCCLQAPRWRCCKRLPTTALVGQWRKRGGLLHDCTICATCSNTNTVKSRGQFNPTNKN